MKKKVMVFGAFDILHPGHLDFLRQARGKGDFLIVSVARDKNVKKVKGVAPVFSEKERLQNMRTLRIVDKAVLGGIDDPSPHIKKENPDVIALGYDQGDYIDDLLDLRIKVVRLRPFKPNNYKSSKIRDKVNKWVKHIK